MIVLGLHLGHDASIAIVRDGKLLVSLERERTSRVKHCRFLTITEIRKALSDAGLTVSDVDYCAITTTQENPFVFLNDDLFKFSFDFSDSPFTSPIKSDQDNYTKTYQHLEQETHNGYLVGWFHSLVTRSSRSAKFNKDDDVYGANVSGLKSTETFSEYAPWSDIKTYDDIAAIPDETLNDLIFKEAMRFKMHMPVKVSIDSVEIPGALVAHQYAHAGTAYYMSPYDHAAICTYDGGQVSQNGQYTGGFFFIGSGDKIIPVVPNLMESGWVYRDTGAKVGLEYYSAPGKLMGLAPYGKPHFYDPQYIKHSHEFSTPGLSYTPWFEHCLERAKSMGYDTSPIGKQDRVTEKVCCDIAASTQLLFEETTLHSLTIFDALLKRAGAQIDNLCFAGGSALNCPTNTRAANESGFTNVFVPPGCDDSGLAIGAALLASHNFLGEPFKPAVLTSTSAYLGLDWGGQSVEDIITEFTGEIICEKLKNTANDAAEALADNQLIAWYDGRSETGPRALGHRSILANPLHFENWERVNRVKNRENWRPFAPSVIEEEAHNWFEGAPLPSPYMLFTAQVKGDKIPAITHIDNTARVQTVSRDCGMFYQLIKRFGEITSVPVVLNTSFNGPGEPIVETPYEAIKFFANSQLDVLFVNGYRITRVE